MSQVFKRIGSRASLDFRNRKGVSYLISQWQFCSFGTCSDVACRATGSSAFSKLDVSKANLHGIRRVDQRRSMSFLTDLLRRKKKDDEEEEEVEETSDSKVLQLFEDPPKELTEEEIEAKRNISRLNPYHLRLVRGQHPYEEPMTWIHHTVRYKQRMFGKYGESSGVNPGLLWPTKKELIDKIEYEKISHPFTIQEMIAKKKALRQAEEEATQKRIKEVESKMAMLNKYKEDLLKKQQQKEDEAEEARLRREKLVEEVKRHFGYSVDPRDEKFQEMLAKKEKEQRKNMKEAKKLEKQQKMLQKLEKQGDKSKKSAPVETATKEKEED